MLRPKEEVLGKNRMPNQFEEFFEEMFSHAMSYKGDPVMKDQVFTHYILGKPHEQRASLGRIRAGAGSICSI